ncbi:MAG: high-affinity iron transporter [Ilumatobacteraceae bacterium]|jgi:high-affinity iron transporter
MGASFLITLREGLEIALVIAIVTAYLAKSGRVSEMRSVFVGSALAAATCIVAGLLVHAFTDGLTGKSEPATEGFLALASCAVLTWMIFWMRRNSRSLGGELRAKVDAATTTQALTLLAFIAVAREGFETVLFLLGAETQSASGGQVVFGGIIGLSVAAVLGWLVHLGGQRVNLGTFFRYTGVLMILFAAGLAGKAAHEMSDLFGFRSGSLIDPMWNLTSGPLATGTFRDFIEGLFGWSPNPERIRVFAYVIYAIPVLWMYLRSPAPVAPAAAARPSAVTARV